MRTLGFGRDRHGRGMRGPLSTDDLVSELVTTRHELFAMALGDAVQRLRELEGPKVDGVTVNFTMIPTELESRDTTQSPTSTTRLGADGRWMITFHRMAVQSRLPDPTALNDVVYELLLIEWAHLTGKDPATIDPEHFG